LAWGDNQSSQIGDGTFAERRSPVLVVNTNADGFLNLQPSTAFEVPPALRVPFFVVSSGAITDTSALVSTTIKFDALEVGKSGAVYVTARAASGSMRKLSASMASAGGAGGTYGAWSALTAADSFELMQLTSTGWQSVVSGQLIAYASGVLGDQISAQTILDNTDTTNLKGAQFCIGYGTSAEQMIAAGAMRAIATIPDPSATSVGSVSCIVEAPTSTTTTSTTSTTTTTTAPTTSTTTATPTTTTTVVATTTSTLTTINLSTGWNLVGNGSNEAIDVASIFSDSNRFLTVWKWIAAQAAWAFHAPSLAALGTLADYVTSKGYQLLTSIAGGEGFWVNAQQTGSLNLTSGSMISVATVGPSLVKGWNLVSVGEAATPKQFCDAQTGGVTTLWAWDSTNSAWYFYAPTLDSSGGLSAYITSKGYLDFTTTNKMLGQGVGFWINRP
jgi:hypothetical protein